MRFRGARGIELEGIRLMRMGLKSVKKTNRTSKLMQVVVVKGVMWKPPKLVSRLFTFCREIAG